MERRKFLIGAGSAAVGSSALIGSGAFTSVSAERTARVAVATDENAYLALTPTDERASLENGELVLDFSTSDNGSEGLNPNARTAFTDLFEIKNQGDNPVYVGVGTDQEDVYQNGSSQDNAKPHLADYDNIQIYQYAEENGSGPGLGFNGGNGNMHIDSGGRVDVSFDSNGSSNPDENPRILTPGESIRADFSIITDEGTSLTGDGGNRITVAAAEPDSDRSNSGNGT